MAGPKEEQTHKHRNILDDILDLGLVSAMVAWYFTGIELDKETLAMLGGAGASARVFLRRILMHFWGDSLGPARDTASEGTVRTELPDPADRPDDNRSEEDREEGDEEG